MTIQYYVIRHQNRPSAYWNKYMGWVELRHATMYTGAEQGNTSLPAHGLWKELETRE